MTRYPFKNRYTEILPTIDKEVMDAVCYVARKINRLPPDTFTMQMNAQKSSLPMQINRIAPLFGSVEVNRSTVTHYDEQFLGYWEFMDHAQITFAWTHDGPFFQGEIWENEPELIIAEVYECGDLQEDCVVHAFIHETLLQRSEMSNLKDKIVQSKLSFNGSFSERREAPIALLEYSAMRLSWPDDIYCELENEIGEDEMFRMGSLAINELIFARHLKAVNDRQSENRS